MIGKLRGKIELVEEDRLLIDVGGIGYSVFASNKTLNSLSGKIGQEISLIIETIVREDYIHLYGFADNSERFCFNELCRVNGVGNKVALKILGSLSVDEVILGISAQDKNLFSAISGIGPKLALRIISELKDRVGKIPSNTVLSSLANDNAGKNKSKNIVSSNQQLLNDASSALENLGYKRSEIYQLISAEINDNPEITLETLITNSLRKINSKKR